MPIRPSPPASDGAPGGSALRHAERRFALPDGGAVSGTLTLPADGAPVCTVVLAHGAGSTRDASLLVAVADGLAAAGCATARFNFPYRERGARVPDRAPVLEACYRAVLEALRADPACAGTPLVIGGASMGGRMATHLAAAGEPVAGVVLLGYPLHPAGRPTVTRSAHLPRIAVPMLFVTGSRDALCPLDDLRPVLATLPAATLHVVEEADHSFGVRVRSGRTRAAVCAEVVAAITAWLPACDIRSAAARV